ncbi:hypothetical protein FOCC_FOCC011979 [Frankliniella occidentalis]|nr:hypothetical protein FOCC_FOCC011979 [Frankliniella occidentalis]
MRAGLRDFEEERSGGHNYTTVTCEVQVQTSVLSQSMPNIHLPSTSTGVNHTEHNQANNYVVTLRRQVRAFIDPFRIPDNTFRSCFRLTKPLFGKLMREITPYLPIYESPLAVPNTIKVLSVLSVYATGSYQAPIRASFLTCLGRSTLGRYIKEVTNALNHQRLKEMDKVPKNCCRREHIRVRNERALGIPGVIGFVDGTEVSITKPPMDLNPQGFWTRKHHYALNCQVVADCNMFILNVNASYPGSTGDSAYPTEPWMLILILDAPEESPLANYTQMHCHARCTIDRTFGILKGRECVNRCENFVMSSGSGERPGPMPSTSTALPPPKTTPKKSNKRSKKSETESTPITPPPPLVEPTLINNSGRTEEVDPVEHEDGQDSFTEQQQPEQPKQVDYRIPRTEERRTRPSESPLDGVHQDNSYPSYPPITRTVRFKAGPGREEFTRTAYFTESPAPSLPPHVDPEMASIMAYFTQDYTPPTTTPPSPPFAEPAAEQPETSTPVYFMGVSQPKKTAPCSTVSRPPSPPVLSIPEGMYVDTWAGGPPADEIEQLLAATEINTQPPGPKDAQERPERRPRRDFGDAAAGAATPKKLSESH